MGSVAAKRSTVAPVTSRTFRGGYRGRRALKFCAGDFPSAILTEVRSKGVAAMWSYYLYMALLITTLVLWAIVAMRDDGHEPNGSGSGDSADTASGSEKTS